MKKRIVAIITILCFLLTACGQSRQVENVQESSQETTTVQETKEEVINWEIEEQILPNADEAISEIIPEDGEIFTEQWELIDETVYRVVLFRNVDSSEGEEEFKGCCIQMIESPYIEWVNTFISPGDWVEGEICSPWNYGGSSIMTRHGFNILLEGEQGTYLGKWTKEEGATAGKIDSDILTKDSFINNYSDWWIGNDDSFFLYDFNEYIQMDDNLEITNRLGREEGYYVNNIVENHYNGSCYLICPAEFQYEEATSMLRSTGMKVLSTDGKNVLLETEDIIAGGDENISFTSETEGYLYQSFNISKFSLEEGAIELLYDFNNDAVYLDKMYNPNKGVTYMNIVNGIQGGYAKADGSHVLLVACSDGTYQVWQMRPENEEDSGKQKQVLEWATTFPSAYEQLAVSKFNKQNEDYKIVFRLPDEGEEYEDFRTRIQAELSAGDGPDILSEGSAINVEAGAKKGFLTNLTEYFAEYEDVILPSAWKLGLVEGQRYAVPYSCSITTVVTDKRLVDNKECWTLDEAMNYMEQSGASYFMAGEGEAELFFYLGLQSETNQQMVDWQNGISHLDSESAVKLLEFANKYADHESTVENKYAHVSEGKAMTSVLYLLDPEAMRLSVAMFEGNEVYIGFPTENEESGHRIDGAGLAVNQASPCVEGAVEFIRFLLSEENQFDMAEKIVNNSATGFPVRSNAMEKVYDYLQDEEDIPEGVNINGGLEYKAVPLSDDSIEKLRELIETARPMGYKAGQLFEIVDDEISGFRLAGKSAQQVLDSVNSRAQLYLDETSVLT